MRSPTTHFPWRYILAALLGYSTLQLLFLGLAAISGSTEAREAQVVDVVVREGEWVLPLRNGIIPSKPPLFHWIGAALSILFGAVSEFSARLPSHIAALGVLVCAALCSFRIAQYSRTIEGDLHPQRAALVSAAVLSLTYGFHQLAFQAMVDMTFSLCLWGALTSLVCSNPKEWSAQRRISSTSRALFWSCCALGALARGPLGVALPLFLVGVTGVYLAGLRVTLREIFRPSIGWLAVIIPLAWYYAAFIQGGEAFLARQLLFENVKRFVGGEQINTEAWWFYLPSLMRTTFPWGLFMAFGVWRYATRARTLAYLGGFKAWVLSPAVALIAGVFIFSLSSGKRHSYMLPLEPFVAVQLGILFSLFVERQGAAIRDRLLRVSKRVEGVLIGVLIVLLVAIGIAYEINWEGQPLEELLKLACRDLTLRAGVVGLATLIGLTALRHSGRGHPYARVWLLMVVLMTVIVSAGNVVKGASKGFPIMTRQLLLVTPSRHTIAVIKDPFDEYFDPIIFYARRSVSILDAAQGIKRCEPEIIYVAKRTWLEHNAHKIPGVVLSLATLQELNLALRGANGRELEVFRCTTQETKEPYISGPLRDAKMSDLTKSIG